MFPQLTINLRKLEENTRIVVDVCRRSEIDVIGVTKGCLGHPRVAHAMLRGGVTGLADSRIGNLKKLQPLCPQCLMLLRQPMVDEYAQAVELADVCLVSEYEACRNLSDVAAARGRQQRVLVMAETGGLRDGVPILHLEETIRKITALRGLVVEGLATNIACFQEPCSAHESLEMLAAATRRLRDRLGLALPIVSGGNSSAWKVLEQGAVPLEVTQLRIGEAILLGQDTADYEPVSGAHRDVFRLTAEVLEMTEQQVQTTEGSERTSKRVVVAVGKQDIGDGALVPRRKGADIVRISSDHLVLDLNGADSHGSESFELGRKVTFMPDYFALLGAMTSPYVHKTFLD